MATHNIPRSTPQKVLRNYLRTSFQTPKKGVPPTSAAVFQEFTHGVDDFKLVMPKAWQIMSVFPAQPFAFDSRVWLFKEMDGYLAYEATKVGKEGAGPTRLRERHVQWLHLVHKKNPRAHLHLLNVHAPPSIHVPLQPGAERSRDDLHEELMQDIADKISKIKTPVILGGDFNTTWNHQNLQPIRATGLELANRPKQATLHKRQIDLLAYRGGAGKRWQLECEDSGRLPKLKKGEHNGVWATFDYTRC